MSRTADDFSLGYQGLLGLGHGNGSLLSHFFKGICHHFANASVTVGRNGGHLGGAHVLIQLLGKSFHPSPSPERLGHCGWISVMHFSHAQPLPVESLTASRLAWRFSPTPHNGAAKISATDGLDLRNLDISGSLWHPKELQFNSCGFLSLPSLKKHWFIKRARAGTIFHS